MCVNNYGPAPEVDRFAIDFSGFVIEREDTRSYDETRYQAIGELLGEIYVLEYTRQGRKCRLITAWEAEPEESALSYEFR